MTDEAPSTTVVVTNPRDQWLLKRREVITGTDLAALFGVDRYKRTAMDVWLDKTGRSEQKADSGALRFGRRFERPILEEYADAEGVALIFADSHNLMRSDKWGYIGATLDAQRVDDKSPVDAKNLGYRSPEFGPDGSDVIPLAYMLQLMAQMMVTMTERAALAVLFNRYEFARFPIKFDPIVAERIHERATLFMANYVQTDTPPPVDGSSSWTDWIGKHFRQQHKDILTATEVEHEFAVALHDTQKQSKVLEEEAEGLRNRLKLAIGEAGGMEGPDWRITWSQSKDKTKVNWKALAEKWGPNPTSDVYIADLAAHTTTEPASRTFRFTFKEESAE